MKARLWKLLKEDGVTLAIVLALAIAYIVLRTPGDTFASVEEFESKLAAGRPTVIEFYSNTCSICLLSKPEVDRLASELEAQATILRLNVKSDTGRTLANRWQVSGVPTFFVFDGASVAIYRRPGAPDSEAIKAAVAAALTAGD